MGIQADDERLAELNRNKERYEEKQEEERGGEDPQLQDEVRENLRRNKLQEQKENEVRKQREEVEASASRVAAGKKQYRQEKDKQEIEDSAGRIAAGRAKFRQDRDAEVEASAVRIAATRKEDKYRRTTPIAKQAMHTIGDKILGGKFGRPDPNKPQPVKEVRPINTFGGAVAFKAKQHAVAAKNRMMAGGESFLSDLARPAKAIEKGRKVREQGNQKLQDPFMQLAPPQRKRSRNPNSAPPIRQGTGFLFTEGFINPPKKGGRNKKGGGGRRNTGSVMDYLL